MKTLTVIMFACVLLTACKPTSELPPTGILSVGHGGAGFDTYRNSIPPNIYASVHQGLIVEGADAVEIDIQMTLDSVLVLYHDYFLESKTTCKGCVALQSYDQLGSCEVYHRNGPVAGKYPIPLLSDILNEFHDGTRIFYLNVKTPTVCIQDDPQHRLRMARALSDLVTQTNCHANTYIETYDLDMLSAVQEVDSNLMIIYDEDDLEKAVQVALENDFEGIGVVNEAIDADQVEWAQAQGLEVVIWGVRVLQGTKQAVSKKPDAIMTDDIRMLKNVLGR